MYYCIIISLSEDIFNRIKLPKKDSSTSGNLVQSILMQSGTIESYTLYDVTNSRLQKMTVAFLATLEGKNVSHAGPEFKLQKL